MSKDENIVSMSGQPIFRYIDGEKEWEAPHGNRVLQYCPLYDEEMKLKLNKGSNLLLNKFDQYGISDLITIDRKNVAKKRFGIF